MDSLSEKDYSELIGYLIEQLREYQADDIIQQIRELETVNVIEKAEPMAAKKLIDDSDQTVLWESVEFSQHQDHKPGVKPGKKPDRDSVSEYSSRPMRREEIFYAAIDILETYLISVPRLFAELGKGLDVDLSRIVWKNEVIESVEEEAPVDILMFDQLLEPERQSVIEQMIERLRKASRKERI